MKAAGRPPEAILPLVDGSKGLGVPNKMHTVKGHFSETQSYFATMRTMTTVFSAEVDDPDNMSIPLWMTPTHKQEIELYVIGDHAENRVRLRS
jgi:hypothetical protein